MDSLQDYIESHARTLQKDNANITDFGRAVQLARDYTEELNVHIPSPAACAFIEALAGTYPGRNAVMVSAASPVLALHIAHGLRTGSVTVLEPDAETLAVIKKTMTIADLNPNKHRLLTTRRLDVLTRLADESYSLVYSATPPVDMRRFIESSWPLLHAGGTLILDNLLLDGTVSDSSRRDSNTVAARETIAYLEELNDAIVAQVPLDSGLVVVTKTSGQY
ncbi:MAG: hypothetical protein Q3972_01970 [Corynebacterium sp.]|nr:hypothetical protein [Corynebacterium sp.]